MAVCSFKPPFEADAYCSHLSVSVYWGGAVLFIHSLTVLVFLYVCTPFCLCLLVVVCVGVC